MKSRLWAGRHSRVMYRLQFCCGKVIAIRNQTVNCNLFQDFFCLVFFLLRKKEPVLGREKLLPVFPAPGSETSLHYSKHQCHLWVGVLFLHKNISVKPVQRDLVILKRTSFKKTVSSQSNSSVLALRSSVACQNTDLFLNSLFVVYHLYIERNIVLLVSQHGTFAWIFCVSL